MHQVCIQRRVEKPRSMELYFSLSFNSVFQFNDQYKRLHDNLSINCETEQNKPFLQNGHNLSVKSKFLKTLCQLESCQNSKIQSDINSVNYFRQLCNKIRVIATWSTIRSGAISKLLRGRWKYWGH